jgi:hypothetical protein
MVPFVLVLMLGDLDTWSAWAKAALLVGWLVFFLSATWWFHSWVIQRPAKQASGAS